MIEKHDYTIDEKFIFEQQKCLIYLKGDLDQSVELSKPAARLFGEILLLNFKKGIATRDELLTNVWEEYGLVGSNNNLNTYISEIRKKLEQVGIDPKTIVTVPKKGFRIDSHLSNIEIDNEEILTTPDENIYTENYNITESNAFTLSNSITSHSLPLNSGITPTVENTSTTVNVDLNYINETPTIEFTSSDAIKSNKKKIITRLLLLIIATAITYFLFSNNEIINKKQENTYYTISKKDSCLIQTPIEMSHQPNQSTLEFVNKKLEKYNISCDEPKRIIVLFDTNSDYTLDKNISLSICKEKNEKPNCVSINDQRI
ncbi:helix-turn-helix domain-containing protein [Providencia rustigianii]|uniref:winged helix-turn-helix domain-containing protein n=1 Tax=Providencia rustigianii TaxID=158850 RepID=UPI000F71EF52|nr:helix-turn-helix domain-containing protein [Providencia rustigianii]MTC59812.1 helix-turn-helix domain-containing protein [Providencia rustigianii]VEH53614.1 Probable regulatory protein embR [Providencia rustigianii]